MTRIEAVNVCPNGKLGHLVKMEPGVCECLNCKFGTGEDNDKRTRT